ncbi:MAG: EAL domain-containing protein, partial [Candidatus Competibacterales bacterium]|nr:EAL domain-containing protein [Candidatus Competibacterales bacterium]
LETIRELASWVADYRVPHGRVVFEITEREALPHLKELRQLQERAQQQGIAFALDDFGSGFSSFLYLKYLKVDYVKIEGSFVRHIAKDKGDRIMVSHINSMAHAFGIKTVAEYVEDHETHALLRELGVDLGQGYYYGHARALSGAGALKSD